MSMNKFIVLFLLLIPIAVYATPISPIIPSGTTLPATCRAGALFIDTDQDTDGALYQCVATDTWKIVGSGAGGGIDTSGTPVAFDIARFTDVDTIEGRSYTEFIADLAIITADGIDDTPVDGETAQPISSNWAYDHVDAADPHTGYAKESIVGTSLNADDLELDGAVLQTAAEIPHTDVAETVSAAWALRFSRLTAQIEEPTDEAVFDIIRADGGTWDPCGLGSANDYLVLCTAAGAPGTYVALLDIAGDFKFSTIQAAMKVIPDADGITLTAAQMNAVIVVTNAGEVQIPADQCDTVTGKWVTVKQTGAYDVDIAVLDAADDIYMTDGTKVEGTTNELQTAGASGNQITLMCIAVNEWWVTGEIGTSTSEAAD